MVENKSLSRLELFSDGVFAIAITLLVLDLKVPPIDTIHSTADLWHGLFQRWTYYFAFVFSFSNILAMWINHENIFSFISKATRPLMWANGFMLLTIVFLPYPTALLAEYIGTPYMQPAIVFYITSTTLINIAWNLFAYIMRKPEYLLKPGVDEKTIKRAVLSLRVGFIIYALTAILAWWFPVTALVISASLLILWMTSSLREKEQ